MMTSWRLSPLFVVMLGLGCWEPEGAHVSEFNGGCVTSECHDAVEQIHYGGPALTCVDCHLGDATSLDKEEAHVTVDISFNPSTPGETYLDRPSLQELDELPLDVIQFLNPSDYRVAATSCGEGPLGGASCHGPIVESSLLMTRATLAGQLAGGAFLVGLQDKDAHYGSVQRQDDYVPAELPEGYISEVELWPESPADDADPLAAAFHPVVEQLCLSCHLGQDGHRQPGLYYSSGCNACHLPTSDSSRAETADETQDLEELGHVQTHRFTNRVPDSQCARCHISHLGRSLLAQGVRERSEPDGDEALGGPNRGVEDPEHMLPWSEDNYVPFQGLSEIYGKPYPYFIEDEDDTNEVDETPPDVHTAAGLGCIDCHNIRESHGSDAMPGRMDLELDVRCQSCRGRPGDEGPLRSESELAFTISETTPGDFGTNTQVFETRDDGSVLQLGRFTGALHPVTQITERTDAEDDDYNPRTRAGCELHAGSAERRAELKAEANALAASDPEAEAFPGLPPGFTFTIPEEESAGRVECFTCHNAWTVNCYGCHMVRDDRESYVSPLSGETRQGKASTYGMSVVADSLSMGINGRGKISPMVGTAIFFTHIDDAGDRVIDAAPVTDGDGVTGEGNVHNPVHHHTIRQEPRDCDGCHPAVDDTHEDSVVLTATGLGSGRYTFEDGEGNIHQLDRLVAVDTDGDGEEDDPTLGDLPTLVYEAWPVVSTTHIDESQTPGPLDAEAINLVLGSPVVPQRAEETE